MTDTDYRKLLSDALPDLTIGNRLGKGGQGLVFCAEGADGRKIACKVLFAGRVENAERFDNEIAALKGLEHPNVVPIIGNGVLRGEHGKVPYLLMPQIDGLSISDDFKNHRRSVEACVKFFLQICDALSYAHKRDVIHRDMKPGNILIDSSNGTLGGRAWVVDFGMALAAGEKPDPNTSSAWKHAATLCYMSPEQADGQSLDARTDIYSLGVVMYELLSDGGFPYPIHDATPVRIMRHIWETVPASLRGVNPAVDARLSNVVHKCLEKDKTRRYGSMDELRADLKRWQDGKAVKARSDTRWHHMKKTARRHKLAVAVAAIIAGLSIFSTLMWQRAEQQAATHLASLDMARCIKLGSVERDAGRVDQALELWQQALQISREASGTDVDRFEYEALHRLAELYYSQGNAEAADPFVDRAVSLCARRIEHDAGDHEWRRLLGFAHRLRGQKAAARSEWGIALSAFSESLAIRQELVDSHPSDDGLRSELAAMQAWVGRCHRNLGNSEQAFAAYSVSYDLRMELALRNPDSTGRSFDLLQSEAKMAVWYISQKTNEANQQAQTWLDIADLHFDEMENAGMWDNRRRDCDRMAKDLKHNRAILERRSGP